MHPAIIKRNKQKKRDRELRQLRAKAQQNNHDTRSIKQAAMLLKAHNNALLEERDYVRKILIRATGVEPADYPVEKTTDLLHFTEDFITRQREVIHDLRDRLARQKEHTMEFVRLIERAARRLTREEFQLLFGVSYERYIGRDDF